MIRGNIYNIPSIVVDTHVKRISRKLGLTREEEPEKVEYDLMKVLPEDHWILWNIHIITLGADDLHGQKPPDADSVFLRRCVPPRVCAERTLIKEDGHDGYLCGD